MRALACIAIAVVFGCQSTTKRRRSVPQEPRKVMARQLTLDAITAPALEVTRGGELVQALKENRRPVARLVEVVEVKWRDHMFDREVLGDMIAGNYEHETRTRFKARFGLDYEAAFRVFLYGYAAQLVERFGIAPREMNIADDRGRWLVNVWGTLDGDLIEWKSGAFALRGPYQGPSGKPLPKTFETVVISNNGDYYGLAELGDQARFKPRGDERGSDRIHRGEVLRTYLETADYRDATGRRFSYPVPNTRATPYIIARPGGYDSLTQDLHVVRIELDQTAQPGSAILIESFTVLDGTKHLAALGPAYKTIWGRFNSERLAALARVARETAALDASLAAAANDWARRQSPSGRLETEKRDYNTTLPTYKWDAATKTLTIIFRHRYSNVVFHKIGYPNPELKHFHCPPGAPCAVPPDRSYHVLEQRYDVLFEATYEIDRDATLKLRELEGPRIEVRRP